MLYFLDGTMWFPVLTACSSAVLDLDWTFWGRSSSCSDRAYGSKGADDDMNDEYVAFALSSVQNSNCSLLLCDLSYRCCEKDP